jgi:death-on-curing protein
MPNSSADLPSKSEGPLFLTRAQVEALHDASLAMFGGLAGIGDSGLIDSALASAQNAYFYGRGDVFDIAAAYAFHLAEAQAFMDGNKRTAVLAALSFLEGNGCYRTPDQNALYNAMIDIANKRLTKAGLAEIFRRQAQPQQKPKL